MYTQLSLCPGLSQREMMFPLLSKLCWELVLPLRGRMNPN